MKQKTRNKLWLAIALLCAFVLWTVAVRVIDVQTIGPRGSAVGFATMNGFVHSLTGVHMTLYVITDWLGLVPISFALGFAILGLVQWIGRRGLRYVDFSLFALGGFYLLVMAAYILFEEVVINYRPVLIQGYLEASYPSSTTLLVLCVMPAAILQFNTRINNRSFRQILNLTLAAFTAFMVIGRLVSGVHWFSDIVGGVLLSAGLVLLYDALSRKTE